MECEYVPRRRLTLLEYLAGEETNRPMELDFGVVRQPAAPSWAHQMIAGRAFVALHAHVSALQLGAVVQSPVDVILDRERDLVVQPDVVFVSNERLHMCTDRVWGPPDLAVEVLSLSTARHDSTIKLSWFEQYGVRECWLVDPVAREVVVVDFTGATRSVRGHRENDAIQSRVLPDLCLRVGDVLT